MHDYYDRSPQRIQKDTGTFIKKLKLAVSSEETRIDESMFFFFYFFFDVIFFFFYVCYKFVPHGYLVISYKYDSSEFIG